jgi:5-amino-6-(5-phosphoribosylamino)uracil reductase
MELESYRPHTTIVLAMSADGKIADAWRSPARFGSATDKAHLEIQIAGADGVLFGAATLRAYHTTLRVTHPDLLQQRKQQNKPPQPVHVVCSGSAQLNPDYPFFRQPVPRWLLTSALGAEQWRDRPEFEQVLVLPNTQGKADWAEALHQLSRLGLERLVVTGGGEIVAALLAANLIDELWLTVCPLILGGLHAPTPVSGEGFPESLAPRLQLLSVQSLGQEVLLHYCLPGKEN